MTTIDTRQFERIAEIAKQHWGLSLSERKRQLVTNRLSSFLLKSRFATVAEYLQHLDCDADNDDMLVFFDLLSTNVTSFFREQAHFDYLEREFYTPLARGNLTTPGRNIRMWSAACSNGAEPYSMAIHAREHLPKLDDWDFKILASDLSNSAIQAAKEGVYPENELQDLDRKLLRKYFLRKSDENQISYKVAPLIRDLVSVGRLNLMDKWPMRGSFDVIFCRNCMIYFDRPTRKQLVQRMCNLLRPGGLLVIGSAETLSGLDMPVKTVSPSVYQWENLR